VRRDQPVDIFKQKFVAEAFSGGGKLNHISFKSWLELSSHRISTKY
jgi:hypothetical protein